MPPEAPRTDADTGHQGVPAAARVTSWWRMKMLAKVDRKWQIHGIDDDYGEASMLTPLAPVLWTGAETVRRNLPLVHQHRLVIVGGHWLYLMSYTMFYLCYIWCYTWFFIYVIYDAIHDVIWCFICYIWCYTWAYIWCYVWCYILQYITSYITSYKTHTHTYISYIVYMIYTVYIYVIYDVLFIMLFMLYMTLHMM